jgi:uncharacterized protein (TIGR02246 family)
VLAVLLAWPAAAEDKAADLAAIRQGSQAFMAAFNKGDSKAVAALWTDDGDFTDDAGRIFAGREDIEKEYAAFFAEHPGVQMRIVIDSLKLLSDSAAIEDGRAFLEPAPVGPPAVSKYTVVHVKAGGQWLMSTVRDTRVETPSGYRRVSDLEWLIGKWTAEEHGAKMESACRWVANKSFVERTFTTTQPSGITTSGVQLIGFNPDSGQIQSWTFSSDGGHAIGIWSPTTGGWLAEIRGVSGDGVPTTAVNRLIKLDDNAYTWQSVQRTSGGRPLADTEEVVLRRGK